MRSTKGDQERAKMTSLYKIQSYLWAVGPIVQGMNE